MTHLDIAALIVLATTTIAVATPLLLAALGEVVVEKAGVINVGIEGMMLTGAFAAYAGAHQFASPIAGAFAAIGAGVAFAALFALLTVRLRADQVVVGTALNILALGLTGVFTPLLQSFQTVPSFHPFKIITSHGQSLAADGLAVFALVLAPLVTIFLNRTSLGLRLRATGEYPAAAADAGSSVAALRTGAVLFGGALAGLSGACLSIAYNVGIAQGISSGRGFIALAVVIVGRWNPVGALGAALLFGAASALQAFGQARGWHVPYQALLALPYVLTLAALVIRAGRISAPAALGEPYPAN